MYIDTVGTHLQQVHHPMDNVGSHGSTIALPIRSKIPTWPSHISIRLTERAVRVEWQRISPVLGCVGDTIQLIEQLLAEEVELKACVFALVLGLYEEAHVVCLVWLSSLGRLLAIRVCLLIYIDHFVILSLLFIPFLCWWIVDGL